jgi:hypothetical protein
VLAQGRRLVAIDGGGGGGAPAVSLNFRASGQIAPNKSKQNGLDLLGFIRPIWDFSMGYGESK